MYKREIMKTTVYESDFLRKFKEYGREDNFTFEGLQILFEYLEQYEEDTGEEIELDVISLCGDYCELTYLEFIREYRLDIENYYDTEDCTQTWEEALEEDKDWVVEILTDYINENTSLVGFTDEGTVIYQVW